jgi:hypothetical protein
VTVPPYSPYSHKLATSDFHVFDNLKDALQGHSFADDVLKHSMREKLGYFSKKLYANSIQLFAQT